MYRFTSFDENDFYEAINKKPEPDYSRLKNCVINAIRNNPGFNKAKGQNNSEARIIIDILLKKVPQIFEDYESQPGERVYNPQEASTWDKEYFIRQTCYLRENFSLTRYNNLKSIGRKLEKGVAPNFQEPQEQCQTELQRQSIEVNVQQTPQKTNPLLVLGAVALAIIVLVVIVAVIK